MEVSFFASQSSRVPSGPECFSDGDSEEEEEDKSEFEEEEGAEI
jgi:hypothetical protein